MKKEIKIALVAVAAIAIIYFGIIFLKGLNLRSTGNTYYVEMADVNGLAPAADIMVNGMQIGTVKTLHFDQARQTVIVGIEMQKGFQMPAGSTATLTKDMLGAPKMKITLGRDPRHLLHVGDTIPGTPMTDLMASAGDMLPSVESLIPKVDTLLAAVTALVSDPALRAAMQRTDSLTRHLNALAAGTEHIVNTQVPALLGQVGGVMANIDQTTRQLNDVPYDSLAANANATLAQLRDLTARLGDDSSTLGLLLNDQRVYNHLDSTMRNAALLLEDLREHPKRYVHFSLFGKKDKADK